jgi:hypothetical protein
VCTSLEFLIAFNLLITVDTRKKINAVKSAKRTREANTKENIKMPKEKHKTSGKSVKRKYRLLKIG